MRGCLSEVVAGCPVRGQSAGTPSSRGVTPPEGDVNVDRARRCLWRRLSGSVNTQAPQKPSCPFCAGPLCASPPPPPRAGRKEVRVSPGSDPMSLLTSQWEDRAGPQLAAVWGLHSSGSQLPSPARELCKALSPFYCILFIKLNCILFIKLWSAGGYGVQVWVSDRMSVLHCVPPATPFPVTSGTDPPSLGPPCVR